MKVSVIIPAFKQAEYLGAAIESVLKQSYNNLECIVVNDASPDHTEEVVQQYHDTRLRYIRHEQNQGLPATRNTGIRAASGEAIFLLDCDDYYHPEKVERHVDYLQKNPEVGCTYNPRFELYYSGEQLNGLVRPPLAVELKDLVLGFPFTPSDMVIRRDWLEKVGGFDGSLRNYSEDLDINCKLALAGCKFASVNKVLNYRRLHTARPLRVAARLDAALQVLERILNDPRCPAEVRALRDLAYRINYLVWADVALLQKETELAQHYLRSALQHDPSLLVGQPSEMTTYLAWSISCDDNIDHVEQLRGYFEQLPQEFESLRPHFEWIVARAFLFKGTRACLWGRPEEGRRHFADAVKWKAEVDEPFMRKVADDLFNYEFAFGAERAGQVWHDVHHAFDEFGRATSHKLQGIYYVNRAFKSLHNGQLQIARKMALNAIRRDPSHLTNRGVLVMLLRTLIVRQPPKPKPQYMHFVEK